MLQNQTILITGTSRGVGYQLAEHYTRIGYRVFGCSRGVGKLANKLYTHIETNIDSENSIKNLFMEISKAGASVDVLINSAGKSYSQLAIFTASHEAENLIRTNLLGSFMLLRDTVMHMKRKKYGRIINISSINVPMGSVGGSVYNATKAALENLSFTMTQELAGDDITINTIGLSVVANTGMAKEIKKKALEQKLMRLSKPEMITADEVVHTIDFFMSPEARNITNQIVYFGGVR